MRHIGNFVLHHPRHTTTVTPRSIPYVLGVVAHLRLRLSDRRIQRANSAQRVGGLQILSIFNGATFRKSHHALTSTPLTQLLPITALSTSFIL